MNEKTVDITFIRQGGVFLFGTYFYLFFEEEMAEINLPTIIKRLL